ncbi:PREDICTED: L-aminoadipate-semialdehyde dehydrogenase-phosphopantetheinyl transferase, partial [Ceratosolen solmsi marchali]|uniref:L-aminoadipate-semialdehyde dehydrogenase-phosphopantetheinyl transferase n=1 Tax=Ceratosolen solmsi marchali TaxID=326594 RepID=A0AAJ7E157_9HYME
MTSIRWAFNTSRWEPSESEFLLASSCLQIEEKNRIDKLVFKKDVKASLIGRLMIRKFISDTTGMPYNSIELFRDTNNKPKYVTNSKTPIVSFNISHHGSYTVLAGEIKQTNIGVDVMKLEYNGGKSVNEFFRIMNKHFSELEWNKIRGTLQTSEQNKIVNFCRNWALKESYVKAIGTGLTVNLSKIIFDIHSKLEQDQIITNTMLCINNKIQPWTFEESLLDSFHCVVVALEQQNYVPQSSNNFIFKKLNLNQILQNAIPLLPQDFEYCKRYF